MADKTWKAAERAIAALFGTVRIPPAVFGQRADRGSHAPDAETDRLALQIKHGYQCPGYLREWLTGIKKNTPVGKTGVVVWHQAGGRFEDSLVILRAVDFAALVQPPPATAPAACALPDTLTDTPSAP
jgi:hypothetical protein